MGAWADLTLTTATIRGIAPFDVVDRDSGLVDAHLLTSDAVAAAKNLVVVEIISKADQFVDQAGGYPAFFDAVAADDDTGLALLLQQVVGWAFILEHYRTERIAVDDRYDADMKMAAGRLDRSIVALLKYSRGVNDLMITLRGQDTLDLTYGEEAPLYSI